MTRDDLEQAIYERTRRFVDLDVLDAILELIAAEREACAKVCEEMESSPALSDLEKYRTRFIADAIRARGQE